MVVVFLLLLLLDSACLRNIIILTELVEIQAALDEK